MGDRPPTTPEEAAELALFNVTLEDGDRARFTDIDAGESSPAEIAGALVKSVEESIEGMGNVALLLSGGYDSRCLLAALMSLESSVTLCCWDMPNPSSETGIARELAEVSGYPMVTLSPLELTYDDLRRFSGVYVTRSLGRLPVTRLRTAATVSALGSQGFDCIVWGEGELVRPPVIPGEYLTAPVMRLLSTGTAAGTERPPESFFSESLPWREAADRLIRLNARTEGFPLPARYASWLRDFSYPGIYGGLAESASGPARVVMPFLASSFTAEVLRRKGSVARRGSWRHSLRRMATDRRLYFEIVSGLAPQLLDVCTDRGYPPGYDGSPLALLHIMFAAAGSALRRRQTAGGKDDVMRRLVADELSLLLPSPLADSGRVSEVLGNPDAWTHGQYFELSKLLGVLRYSGESGDDDR